MKGALGPERNEAGMVLMRDTRALAMSSGDWRSEGAGYRRTVAGRQRALCSNSYATPARHKTAVRLNIGKSRRFFDSSARFLAHLSDKRRLGYLPSALTMA